MSKIEAAAAEQKDQANGEYDRIKTLLHDRNRERDSVFRARNEVKRLKSELNELKAQEKELKEELQEAEDFLHRMIDAHMDGVKVAEREETKASAAETTKANGETKLVGSGDVLESGTTANVKAIPGDQPDQTDIDVLGLSKGRVEKLREAGVNKICDVEAAIHDGKLQEIKGLGQKAVDVITDAYEAYRREHPLGSAKDDEPKQKPLIEEPEADSAAIDAAVEESLNVEFEEDDAPVVEDITELEPGEESQEVVEEDELLIGDDEEVDQELPEHPSKGKQESAEFDIAEIADALANIYVFVPGEVIEGWKPEIRRVVYQWAAEVSDVANGNGDPSDISYPPQVERFLKKRQIQDGVVAFLKEKRG